MSRTNSRIKQRPRIWDGYLAQVVSTREAKAKVYPTESTHRCWHSPNTTHHKLKFEVTLQGHYRLISSEAGVIFQERVPKQNKQIRQKMFAKFLRAARRYCSHHPTHLEIITDDTLLTHLLRNWDQDHSYSDHYFFYSMRRILKKLCRYTITYTPRPAVATLNYVKVIALPQYLRTSLGYYAGKVLPKQHIKKLESLKAQRLYQNKTNALIRNLQNRGLSYKQSKEEASNLLKSYTPTEALQIVKQALPQCAGTKRAYRQPASPDECHSTPLGSGEAPPHLIRDGSSEEIGPQTYQEPLRKDFTPQDDSDILPGGDIGIHRHSRPGLLYPRQRPIKLTPIHSRVYLPEENLH